MSLSQRQGFMRDGGKPLRAIDVVIVVFFGIPRTASAEVSDKIPSVGLIWMLVFTMPVVAVLAWRFRTWVGVLVSSLFVIPIIGIVSELLDPFVGPAILEEQGSGYLVAVVVAASALLGSSAYGFIVRRRQLSSTLRSSKVADV